MAKADEIIFIWINSGAGHMHSLDRLAGVIASDYLVTSVLGMSLLIFWLSGNSEDLRLKNQITVLKSLLAMALSSWAVFVCNALYFRDRPFVDLDVSLIFYQPTDSSMPSNSAAAFFGITSAIWIYNRKLGTILMAISTLHGFSRVYVGVHYPSDVLVGAVIGVLGSLAAYWLWRLLGPVPVITIKAARILCLA